MDVSGKGINYLLYGLFVAPCPIQGWLFWQSKQDTEGDAVHHTGPLLCHWAAHSVPTANVRGENGWRWEAQKKEHQWLSAAFDIGGRRGQWVIVLREQKHQWDKEKSAAPANRYPSWKSHLPVFAWFCLFFAWFCLVFTCFWLGFAWFCLFFAMCQSSPSSSFWFCQSEGARGQSNKLLGYLSSPPTHFYLLFTPGCVILFFLILLSSQIWATFFFFFFKSPKLSGGKFWFYYVFIYNENRLSLSGYYTFQPYELC